MGNTDLSQFNNSWYNPGAGLVKRTLWHLLNYCFVFSSIPGSFWRVFLLRVFGAKISKGAVIKPKVRVKYPWNLTMGKHVWIGESVWIDNLDKIDIGDNVCISQGALFICGNHNYKVSTFDLITQSIVLKNGVWIGANCNVAPGTSIGEHTVLSMGSTASGDLQEFSIYKGNPAVKIADRIIE